MCLSSNRTDAQMKRMPALIAAAYPDIAANMSLLENNIWDAIQLKVQMKAQAAIHHQEQTLLLPAPAAASHHQPQKAD